MITDRVVWPPWSVLVVAQLRMWGHQSYIASVRCAQRDVHQACGYTPLAHRMYPTPPAAIKAARQAAGRAARKYGLPLPGRREA